MGKATRIRWQNLAKLAGGVVTGIALVVGLPALLERPKPPPLPPDVGLTGVADGSPAASLSVTRKTHHRPGSKAAPERKAHTNRGNHGTPRRPQRQTPPEKPDPHRKSAEPQPTPAAASPPAAPAPSPSAPSPA